MAALLFQHKVSDDGNHVLTCWHNVLLAVTRNPFRAVVQFNPALATVVDQCSLDHVSAIKLRAVRIQNDSVEVVDRVDAWNAVVVSTHCHDAEAEASGVLERFRASHAVAATLEELVEQLVFFRVASVPDKREYAVLVHDGVDGIRDDV